MKLSTSTDTLDTLHRCAEKARKPGSVVRVPAGELTGLLLDYSRLLAYAQEHGWRVHEKGTLSNP